MYFYSFTHLFTSSYIHRYIWINYVILCIIISCNNYAHRNEISELPIRPPPMADQVPASWWNPACCDKSLLVGTFKHGCEMYRQMRTDPMLCYSGHIGSTEDNLTVVTNLPM